MQNIATAAVVVPLATPTGLELINDFESSVNSPEVSFDSTASLISANSATSGVTPSGVQGLIDFIEGEPLVGTLTQPDTAVGMWFGNDDFDLVFDAVLEVYSGASLIGSVTVESNANDLADQFIGLSSDMPFDRFEVYYERPAADQLAIYIDDLYLSGIPEPSSVVLFATGVLGTTLLRGRKTHS